MEIYVDTANKEEVAFVSRFSFLDGVTTNPSIIAKENEEFQKIIQRIDEIIDGKVWCQVTADNMEDMISQGREMSDWASDAVIKLPATEAGIAAAGQLKKLGTQVNLTLIYTLPQVILAAKANVDYISPYVGRMDDQALEGVQFINEAKAIIEHMGAQTKIIAASIRSPQIVKQICFSKADAVTVPFKVFKELFPSTLTLKGEAQFKEDWMAYEQKFK